MCCCSHSSSILGQMYLYKRTSLRVCITLVIFQPIVFSFFFFFVEVFVMLELMMEPVDGFMQLWALFSRPTDESYQYSKEPFPDWDRIWTFRHAPIIFPCPEAWKDPVADNVWRLA